MNCSVALVTVWLINYFYRLCAHSVLTVSSKWKVILMHLKPCCFTANQLKLLVHKIHTNTHMHTHQSCWVTRCHKSLHCAALWLNIFLFFIFVVLQFHLNICVNSASGREASFWKRQLRFDKLEFYHSVLTNQNYHDFNISNYFLCACSTPTSKRVSDILTCVHNFIFKQTSILDIDYIRNRVKRRQNTNI